MVKIIDRSIEGTPHYYLSYSYREEKKVKHIEKHLGESMPPSEKLSHLKENFNCEIFEIRWRSDIEKIKGNYNNYLDSLPRSIQVKNLRILGIRFTYNTNKIEGSHLTLKDVALINEDQITPGNMPINDIIEAKSHMRVFEELVTDQKKIDIDLIVEWHKKLFELTKPEFAGIIRDYQIKISNSKYIPPSSGIERKLKSLLGWYEKNRNVMHPVYLACLFHFRFVSLHPFGDGNGRMCRILMNLILYNSDYPIFDIEYKARQGYYSALESANLKKDEMSFISWFFTRYIKSHSQVP